MWQPALSARPSPTHPLAHPHLTHPNPPNTRLIPPLPLCRVQYFTDLDALKRIFAKYGEVVHAYMPRNVSNPQLSRGFAFVQFKHSFCADA